MQTIKERELLKKGTQCLDRGDLKTAERVYSELLTVLPQSIDAYFNLANIFHRRGEIGKAIKAFNKVLTLEPSHTDAAISLSVLYNDIGKYEEAQKVFEVANERVRANEGDAPMSDNHINKKFSIKHFELAEMYMVYNRYDDALFEYNKAMALDTENLESRVKVAKVYAKKGFLAKALSELRTLKNEHPSYMPARISLGILHYGNGNIIEAQTEWKKVLSKDPGNQEAKMYINLSETATETSLN
ncbi:MAG: tetratricopeptide repeat protein [Bdellovibrionales bacterium]|jgi:tetratricopeptide (TPR) repeat protein|nr:tetratricopeptide repeat protein [Bdellovibrionales bacterium]